MNTFKDCEESVANTRRPLTMIRGKALTHEELIQLVINEEPFLQAWGSNGEDYANEFASLYEGGPKVFKRCNRDYCGTLRNILHRKGFDWLDGWVFEDGTVYGSFFEVKYPNYVEYIDKWKELAKRNPFVDMVVAYTRVDEIPCYWCGVLNSKGADYELDNDCGYACNDCLLKSNKKFIDFVLNSPSFVSDLAFWEGEELYKETNCDYYMTRFIGDINQWMYPFNIHKDVMITLHIHDGIVDTLWGEQAQDMFKKYDAMYGDFRLEITNNSDFFSACRYNNTSYERFSDDFMCECFERIDFNSSKWTDEIAPMYLSSNDMLKFVVTKDWLFKEYDRHFNNTGLAIEKMNKYKAKHNEYIKIEAE